MKGLRIFSFALLTCLAVTCTPAQAATTLNYNQPTSGVINPVGQSVSYLLAVTAKDVLNFTVVATLSTSGTFGPCITLYDPNGSKVDNGGGWNWTHYQMDGYQALLTGNYTVVINDCNNQATGDFTVFAQKANNPVAAIPLNYATTQPTTISSVAQANAFTFTANAKDILDITVATTTSKSGTLAVCMELYDSTGTAVLDSAGGALEQAFQMNAYTVPATGTFHLFVRDCYDTALGSYNLFLQKSNAPVKATPLVYGDTQAAAISAAAQSNAYTLSGTAGDLLSFTITTTASTSGALGPCVALYNTTNPLPLESGGNGVTGSYSLENYRLPATGAYNLIVDDCNTTATGSYNLISQCLVGTCSLPRPSISSITPSTAVKGSAALTLTVNGSGFAHTNAASVVQWKGPGQTAVSTLPTSFINTSQLKATIPATDLATVGSATVDVNTPAPGGGTSNGATLTINGATATPTCSPAPGIYTTPVSVMLADATPGAVLYYTTNGTTPTTASSKYTAAIPVTAATSPETIEFMALAPGFTASASASCVYTIEPLAQAPVFTPAVGTYTNAITVALTDATPGAAVYYTTNGTTPTTASAKYTAPIPVAASETLKAIAVAPGYANSVVSSATYTIIGSPYALAVPATAITTTTATLNALVNTKGLAGTYTFYWGVDSNNLTGVYSVKSLSAGTSDVNVLATLANLTTKTRYFYQVVVNTAGGEARGSMLSFTTK